MKELTLTASQFADVVRSAKGDPRGTYRVGETLILCEAGSERQLHVHISFLQLAPRAGGRASCGITVLPHDVRWNRLWSKAQVHLPMLRTWLYELMKETNAEVDEEHFLAAQYD